MTRITFTRTNPRKFASCFPLLLTVLFLLTMLKSSMGFAVHSSIGAEANHNRVMILDPRPMPRLSHNRMSNDNFNDSEGGTIDPNDDEDEDDVEVERIPVFSADVRGRPAGVVLEDLEWRLEKLRLEEANTRRFLKSRPRFLPYRECQKWVQAWGERWRSAEEWNEWIAAGEKKNAYIPSRPDEYYTRTGDWVSWEDFLGVKSNDENSNND